MRNPSFRSRSASFLACAVVVAAILGVGLQPALAGIVCNPGDSCNDFDLCTTSDTCDINEDCVGDPVVCSVNGPCQLTNECNPATGSCSPVTAPDGTPCDDGSLCTSGETCQSGICGVSGSCPAGFTPVPGGCQKTYDIDETLLDNQGSSCDGTEINRYNGCNIADYGFHWDDDPSALAVLRVDVQFQAGIACEISDGRDPYVAVRLNGLHVANFSQPNHCECDPETSTETRSDLNRNAYLSGATNFFAIGSRSCTGLSSDGPFGPGIFARAIVTYRAVNVDCDDGNSCTVDSCDPTLGCVNTPLADGTPCNDENACTQTDTCLSEVCTGSDLVPCTTPPGQCFEDVGTCDPATGSCSYAPVVCAPPDQCHEEGECDPATGSCSYAPKQDGTACDDGSACTSGDTCQSGTCAGNAVPCAPGDQCTQEGECDPATGFCSYVPKPDGTPCNDENECTQTDTCVAQVCTGSNQVTCAPADTCHEDGVCDPATGSCSYAPKQDGTACDDGNACTQTDACQSGVCTGSNQVICAELSSCTIPVGCNPADGRCSYQLKPDGAACDDGNACTQTDTCQGGACTGSNPVTCAPADPCQEDGVCDPATGSCSYAPKQDGTPCDDGNACTQTDTCQSGVCIGSNQVICAELSSCTIPVGCNPADGRCSYQLKPDGAACDDGNACTQTDTCQGGACTGSNPVTCAPADPCQEDGVCDPATGSCSYAPKPDGTACDDGNACTQTDTCDAGVCTGSNPVVCAVLGGCTTPGVCDSASGLCFYSLKADGAACDDGNACTQTDTCQGGACTGSNPVTCAPADPCHQDGVCDPATGSCSYAPKQDGTPCDDGFTCTSGDTCRSGTCTGDSGVCPPPDQCHLPGTCNPSTGACSYPSKPNGTACSDGNACTTGDKCQSGTCTSGTSAPCASPDACHTAGTCNPTSGCTYPEKPNGTSCNDNNSCTTSDKCQSGTCTGTPKTCTAPDACHDATCNPSTGYCTYPSKPNGATCSDGNACTTGDACQSGTCRGNAVTCVAPDACHTATCITTTGACTYPSKPNGTSCNDGSACTTSDKCQSGTCTGTPKTCTPPDSCHSATCNPSTGSCSYPAKSDGAACSDGNACTTGDACQAGTCRTTGTVTCGPPADQCHTQGTCNTSTGVCSNPSKANGTACNDGIACTSGDACSSGACAGAAPQCPTGSIDADTTVRQSSAYQNFGSSRELDAGNSPASVILVKVRVNGTSAVTGATLRLFVRSGTGSSAGSIHSVPCSWTEYGANWNNRPQLGPVLDTKGTYAPNQAVDFNVSSVITGPGTYCFGIDDPSGNYKYNSKEAISFGGRPVLLLATSCSCSP